MIRHLIFPLTMVPAMSALTAGVAEGGGKSTVQTAVLASSSGNEPPTHMATTVFVDDVGLASIAQAAQSPALVMSEERLLESALINAGLSKVRLAMQKIVILLASPGTKFDQLPAALRAAIDCTMPHWTVSGKMPGTREFEGREAIIAKIGVGYATAQMLIAAMGLDWEIIACQNKTLTPAVDGDGVPLFDIEISDGEEVKAWRMELVVDKPLPLSFIDYIASALDENGNESRPTELKNLNQYAGSEPWRIEV